jgi:hypothetical protein
MGEDLVRAKGYAVYRKILVKALNLLITTLMNSIVIEEREWEAKIALRIVVKDQKLKAKDVRLTVSPTIDTVELQFNTNPELFTDDTTITVKHDLSLLESGTFETVIQNIDDVGN